MSQKIANNDNPNDGQGGGDDSIRRFINSLDGLDELKRPASPHHRSSNQETPVARPYTGPIYQFGFVVTESGELHFTIAGKTTAPQPGEMPDMLSTLLDILTTTADQGQSSGSGGGNGSLDDEVLPIRVMGEEGGKGSSNHHEPLTTGNQMDYLFGALGDMEKEQEEFDQTLVVHDDRIDELEGEVHQLKASLARRNQQQQQRRPPWWVRWWRAFWFLDLEEEEESKEKSS